MTGNGFNSSNGLDELAGSLGEGPEPEGCDGREFDRPVPRDASDAVLEMVFDGDDRQQISDVSTFPWRAICCLEITAASGATMHGTGWLAGPGLLLTAGHCVHEHSQGGWVSQVKVYPGLNRADSSGGTAPLVGRAFRALSPWIDRRDRSFDYGAIFLPRDASGGWLGDRLGFFGLKALDDGTLKTTEVNIAGYPTGKQIGTLWWQANQLKEAQSSLLTYLIDTFEGQSGSPVWRKHQGRRQALGIHFGGSAARNAAVRVTSGLITTVAGWRRESQQGI